MTNRKCCEDILNCSIVEEERRGRWRHLTSDISQQHIKLSVLIIPNWVKSGYYSSTADRWQDVKIVKPCISIVSVILSIHSFLSSVIQLLLVIYFQILLINISILWNAKACKIIYMDLCNPLISKKTFSNLHNKLLMPVYTISSISVQSCRWSITVIVIIPINFLKSVGVRWSDKSGAATLDKWILIVRGQG